MSLIAFDQVSTYHPLNLKFVKIKDMYMHESVQSLATRLMSNRVILAYISKEYPCFKGKSDKFVVSCLIAEYLLFMRLLKAQKDCLQDLSPLPSPPLILNAIWTEHCWDFEGYPEFCCSCIGFFISNAVVPYFSSSLRLQCIFKAITLYNLLTPGGAAIVIKHYVDNGIWWPDLIPPYGTLEMPTPLLLEEEENQSKKRDHDQSVGEEKAVPAMD
ncbi:hypothetical protein CYMTET_6429 [Cymbomonas tetramitiformis]|uniref:Uncharacterized protein n=1 Tax=Cymbomonas tetramitiformis TaxID=36881 RepID=A0AAE0GXI5_9CHLO|nr:hypothetical protein CYMTET_6429 [Cymbomonas tetramitiformis]